MFSAVFVVKEPVADCENNVGIAVQKKVGICLLKRGGGIYCNFSRIPKPCKNSTYSTWEIQVWNFALSNGKGA